MKKTSIFQVLISGAALLLALLSVSLSTFAQSGGANFLAGPVMNSTRIYPTMATLPDGRVAAFGGRAVGFISSSYADFYDPTANTFTEIPMNFPHDATCVVKLFDGRYYIIGGSQSLGVAPGYSSCEIFNPATNTFTTAGSMDYARMWMSAAQLTNGHVLIAGAWYDNTAAGVGEYYDTGGHTYTLTGALNQPCADPLMLPTNDGGAMLIGGFPVFGGSDYTRVEYYNPSDNAFHAVSSEIIPADPGWLVTGWPFHNRPYSDYKMSNGKYLIGASRTGEYAFLTFDPATKAFAKIVTSTPLMDSWTNGGFYDFVLDKVNNIAYFLGVDSGYDPIRISLIATDLTTGNVYHPASTFTMPSGEYLYPTIAFMPSNGKILLEGVSSTTGDYFHATDKSYIITPQSRLEVEQANAGKLNVTCYPNPASDVLRFRFENTTAGKAEINIYDMMGRMVANKNAMTSDQSVSIPVDQLPEGMYFYEIRTNETIARDKFIKR
jgi:Secretion system C-terminal sorting domain